MNKASSVMEPVASPSRMAKARPRSHELRQEVHNMLRDVAFVLAQTHRVRDEILSDNPLKRPASE